MRVRKAAEISGKCSGPWGRVAVIAAALALQGCPDDPPESCGQGQAAFSVTLTAGDGPLPEDTAFKVRHGAGEEVFDLDGPCLASDVLFCSPPSRGCDEPQDAADWDGSTGAPPVEALVCELWTNGAALVSVTASGYPDIDRNLAARSNGSCIETVDVELKLERVDGGR